MISRAALPIFTGNPHAKKASKAGIYPNCLSFYPFVLMITFSRSESVLSEMAAIFRQAHHVPSRCNADVYLRVACLLSSSKAAENVASARGHSS
jgi:hypothetical protein